MRIPFRSSHERPIDSPDAGRETLPQGHPQSREGNHLLRTLPQAEYDLLLPHLEPVDLELNAVLYEKGEPIPAVWFIEQGASSWIVVMENGDQVEAGTIGSEGMEGLPLFLGSSHATALSVMQVPGYGKRLAAAHFHRLLGECPTLEHQLRRYSGAFLTMAAQSAACNRLHPLEQRCARWLCMAHDRNALEPEFYLTQEFLATMLGVRRAGVSEAAGTLQRAGIIAYSRGRVRVIDRAGLEHAACECYRVVRRQFEELLGPSPAASAGTRAD